MTGAENESKLKRQVSHGCSGCADGDCPLSEPIQEPPLAGWRMGSAAAAFFLTPVLLAVGGAWLLRDTAPGQLAGALGGLLVGMIGLSIAVYFRGGHREVE